VLHSAFEKGRDKLEMFLLAEFAPPQYNFFQTCLGEVFSFYERKILNI